METALARERGLLRTSEHALTDKETARMALVTECEYVFLLNKYGLCTGSRKGAKCGFLLMSNTLVSLLLLVFASSLLLSISPSHLLTFSPSHLSHLLLSSSLFLSSYRLLVFSLVGSLVGSAHKQMITGLRADLHNTTEQIKADKATADQDRADAAAAAAAAAIAVEEAEARQEALEAYVNRFIKRS